MKYLPICAVLLAFCSCYGQQTVQKKTISRNEGGILGGPFENRDVFYEGMPRSINSIDTSSVWEGDEKSLVLSGRILDSSGEHAIPNVVLYYYHTDANGHYSGGGVHGAIRGWVKSDEDGRYTIYTARPAPYPKRFALAHIHLTVLEETLNVPYYIDNIVFDGDPGLTREKRRALNNRGGTGIVRIRREDGIAYAERDIILGLNIPNYPAND